MVWNVTKDDIKVRMAAKDEDVWPSPALKKKIAPDVMKSISFSEFTLSGREAFPEVVAPLYKEINDIYGTDFKPAIKK
jgi:ribonuclease Z